MVTHKALESRFQFGTDVSPFQCVTSGYVSVWRSPRSRKLLLVHGTDVGGNAKSEDHVSDYCIRVADYDPVGMLKEWMELDTEDRSCVLSRYGFTEDPYAHGDPSKLEEYDGLDLAQFLIDAGYLGWTYIRRGTTNYWGAINFEKGFGELCSVY